VILTVDGCTQATITGVSFVHLREHSGARHVEMQ
jgi:hypothetical protein